MTNSNKRNNSIDYLIVDGKVSTDQYENSEHILQIYNNLYTEHFSWQPKLDDNFFYSIGEVEANWLEKVFKE
jgi:mevalonate pyrophosphate decarboxylase